tara:strand:- start:296 stop:529 length:234 start_codon:yes stop_codon:yes gene_type:complete
MKYILVLYMCSMINNSCPENTIAGYQFTTHFDCVNAGYAIAQSTFRNLQEMEEYEREVIENKKLVIKFECREIGEKI